ncbi:MAG: alpha/beta hydrolase [Clostridia bacterium]|nr:alpha/beta hydrolase [Clostridia bacterium]
MAKKVILRSLLIITIILVAITGYYFVIDRQSNVPESIKEKVNIETNHFMGRKVFKLTPKEEKNEKVILYFHGGSYMAELTNNHWEFLANLSNDTKSTVIVPDYPLAPKSTYRNVLNMIEPLYKETIANNGAENVIVMGDSAGAGMALGLLEKMAINNIKQPSQTILISPWLDISMSNPKIDKVNDKKLDKNKLYLAGVTYSRGIEKEEEYVVSPIKGNVDKLKNITIFIGTDDILNPDCYLLQEKAKQEGVNIEIKEYQKADHIWIIDNQDEISKKAYKDLINSIF